MRQVIHAWLVGVLALAGCPGPEQPDAGDGGLDSDVDAETDAEVEVSGMVGDECELDTDCIAPGARCLRQEWGFRGGYCVIFDLANEGACRAADADSTHVALPCAQPVCMARCETSADCRAGYECFQGLQACWPRCEAGRACPVPAPRLCSSDGECDDGDTCTRDGCVGGICASARISQQPRRAARFASLGPVRDIDFSGHIDAGSLQITAAVEDAGVEVFDLSNPTQPQIYSQITTAGPAVAINRAGDRLVVAEGEAGLEVFDIDTGAIEWAPVIEFDGEPANVQGLAFLGDSYTFALGYRAGLFYVNHVDFWTAMSNRCDTRGRAVDAFSFWSSHIVLVADSLAGLGVCSWTEDYSAATEIERLDTDGRMVALSGVGSVLAAAEAGAGFGIFDVTNPARPVRRHVSGSLGAEVLDVHMTGSATVAVAASDAGLYMYALKDCFEPVLWFQWATDGPAVALDETDGVLAIGLGEAGVELLDLGCYESDE